MAHFNKSKRSYPRVKIRQPDPIWLDDLLQQGGIHLSKDQLRRLWRYHQLFFKRNKDRDLSRVTGFEGMVFKHYVDSLLVNEKIKLPRSLLDIGTGAGLPGIPLKIVNLDINLILAEQRPKRVQFLKEVCKELHFKNIGIFSHKVTSESFQTPVNGVITRALESIPKTLHRIKSFLTPEGMAIFMKGPSVAEELEEFNSQEDLQGIFKLSKDISYELAPLGHERRLIIFERRN